MSETAAKAELMRSLGRLVKGLSALFWGLPIGMVVFGLLWLYTFSGGGLPNPLTVWLLSLNVLPPLAASGFLLYGILQLEHFQRQERIWQTTLDRAKAVGVVNLGLAPFLHWWNQLPEVPLYNLAVSLLLLSGLLFLVILNQVLNRLAAMLPDETVRVETRVFTSLNHSLLGATAVLMLAYHVALRLTVLPAEAVQFVRMAELVRPWLLLFLVLLPVALTMTMIWKIKELILTSAFSPEIHGLDQERSEPRNDADRPCHRTSP